MNKNAGSIIWFIFICNLSITAAQITIVDKDTTRHHFRFLPQSYFEAEYKNYFLPKDDLTRERYMMEVSMHIYFSLFSINNRFFQNWEYHQWTSVGRQDEDISFDPREASFMAIISGEYRLKNIRLQSGLEHPCFHEIDRYELPSAYWNKLFIGIESKRPYHDAGELTPISNNYYERLSWRVRWGYFVRKFGNMSPITLMARTMDYTNELSIDCKYDIYSWRKLVFCVDNQISIGGRDNGIFWSENISAQVQYRTEKLSGCLFVKYTLDDVPLKITKDELLQVGVQIRR